MGAKPKVKVDLTDSNKFHWAVQHACNNCKRRDAGKRSMRGRAWPCYRAPAPQSERRKDIRARIVEARGRVRVCVSARSPVAGAPARGRGACKLCWAPAERQSGLGAAAATVVIRRPVQGCRAFQGVAWAARTTAAHAHLWKPKWIEMNWSDQVLVQSEFQRSLCVLLETGIWSTIITHSYKRNSWSRGRGNGRTSDGRLRAKRRCSRKSIMWYGMKFEKLDFSFEAMTSRSTKMKIFMVFLFLSLLPVIVLWAQLPIAKLLIGCLTAHLPS